MEESRPTRDELRKKERALLAAYRKGNVEALAQLVELYRKPLYAFILRMLPGSDDADDVFQEVWLRAVKNLPHYRQHRFLSWLFSIAHNLIVDRFRREHRPAATSVDVDSDTMQTADLLAQTPDPRPGPDHLVAVQDLTEKLRAALDLLTPEQREVFMLRAYAQLSFKEIARIQKVSINTALGRMYYAVQKLREALREKTEGSR
ncbi:MAG: sigma-70 family RNA polymerase sigma factor [Candidatus Hadarchaeum sp.]